MNLLDKAIQHHRAGALEAAEVLYRQILARSPAHADALHLLGVLSLQRGRADVAVELIGRAIHLNPSAAEFHADLGAALRGAGRTTDAAEAFRRAIALGPQTSNAHANLADLLQTSGDFSRSVTVMKDAAVKWPGAAEVQYNLGNALRLAGETVAAIAAYQRAVELRADFPQALTNWGKILQEAGQPSEAVALFRRALCLAPEWPELHYDLGHALLALGELREGWRQFEWRHRMSDIRSVCYDFPQPRWDGSPLNGRRILLHAEQGFGDTIQFCRYAPLVAESGGSVILQCQPELSTLMQTHSAGIQVISRTQPLPEFDIHCPLLDLPLRFNTTLENIPAKIPYVLPDPQRSKAWATRIGSPGPGLRVGLCWAGRPEHKNDRRRSIRFTELAPLFDIPNVRFFSLQKSSTSPVRADLADWTSDLHDFSDTAALIENLDLVISVDTAVAHLSAAMGKPTWVLLPFVADWRWMLDRTDSPWYPSMKLFRQPEPGDWKSVIAQVAQSL